MSAEAANLLATVLVQARRAHQLGAPSRRIIPARKADVRASLIRYEQLRTRAYARHALARLHAMPRREEVDLALQGITGLLLEGLVTEHTAALETSAEVRDAIRGELLERYREQVEVLDSEYLDLQALLRTKPLYSELLSPSQLRGLETFLMRRAGLRVVWNEAASLYGTNPLLGATDVAGLATEEVKLLSIRVRQLDQQLISTLREVSDRELEGRPGSAFTALRTRFFRSNFPSRTALFRLRALEESNHPLGRLLTPGSLVGLEDLPLGTEPPPERLLF